MDDRAIGVELLSGVSRIVRKLLDEVLVALAELVLGAIGDGERYSAEVLDEVLEQAVGKSFLVSPGGVAEDTTQLGTVGRLDGAEGAHDGLTDVFRGLADIAPVGAVRDCEAVILGKGGELRISVRGFQCLGGLLVVNI